MSRTRAVVMLAVGAILFSTSGLLIKLITIDPVALVGSRSLIAAIVMWGWLKKPDFTWSTAQIGGGVALALTQVTFVIATRETTAANAIFIQYTAPVFVAVFGIWYLGEKATGIDWLTMGAVGVGFYFFFGQGFSLNRNIGDLLALSSGITFAWLWLFLRKQKDRSTTETVLLGNIMAALIGLPFLIGESPTAGDWLGIFYLGIFQLGIPFIFVSIAIRQLRAVEGLLIQTLEPVLNPVWVFLVIGEAPSGRALIGGIIVLVSVTLRGVITSRRDRRPPLPQPGD